VTAVFGIQLMRVASRNESQHELHMKNTNAEVDWYFDQAEKWQQELKLSRTIPLDCARVEVMKWGSPCYALNVNKVVRIHTFEDQCAFLLFNGVLLNDPANIFIQQTKSVQSWRVDSPPLGASPL